MSDSFFQALLPAELSALLRSALTIMTPLIFASCGGLFCELSGMLNIALEGLLLTGAFAAAAAAQISGSIAAGLAAGILASVALALLLAVSTLNLRSNVFITGLAANLFASGSTVLFSRHLFGTRGVAVLGNIPPLPRLWGQSLYVYAGPLLLVAASLVLYKTPFGYRLRACDRHEQALASLGIRSRRYRFAAFLVSGFCCGAGGSFLSLNLGAFVPAMSAGRGWIALVLIFLGGRRPAGLLAASFVYGLAEAFSNYAQGLFNAPSDFILAIPYIISFLAMVAVSVYVKRKNC